jgi:hypothetical protein
MSLGRVLRLVVLILESSESDEMEGRGMRREVSRR